MSVCPLTPMSNMQYNRSLTASCHFRDILKLVTKHFLIYISIWLTTFIFPKTERKQHFLTQNIVFLLFIFSLETNDIRVFQIFVLAKRKYLYKPSLIFSPKPRLQTTGVATVNHYSVMLACLEEYTIVYTVYLL